MPQVPNHTLIQITDLHIVPPGALLRDRLDTFDALAAALATVEESGVAPDALLLTGDLADRGEPAAYARLRALVEPVAARLGAPVLHAMGNHDDRAAMREHLLGVPAGATPLDQVTRLGGLRVVVLDSTVPGRTHGELSAEQLGWLRAELAEPAPDGTVLALHHPPLPSPSRLATAIELRDRAALGAVLAGSDVRIVLAGHTHVVSGGALAGIPVWTGGATTFASDALPAVGGERELLAPTISRIDLFDDAVLATAVPIGVERGGRLTTAQVDDLIAELTQVP